ETGDLAAVLDIAAASPEAATWSREAYETLLANPARDSCWVAEQQGRVVGFICYRVLISEAELLNLAMLPEFRRQRVGAGLLEVALHKAAEAGAAKMFLEVRESNAAALRLYEGFGFSRCGRREGYYANPPADALILVRDLKGLTEEGRWP
ncbi:MAG TPA: ribosomal protein S18-alanine N-acetyltransferase, partial [Candidatus Glassbacteria bacterium]|nr:ribosomal protein S18-alanine N-acetyltransferase [Candidatus Glassbacteria bacterium]